MSQVIPRLSRSLVPMLIVATVVPLDVLLTDSAIAQDSPRPVASQTTKTDKLAVDRFDLMLSRIDQIRIKPMTASEGLPGKVSGKPIFRYSDPARGYVAAGVWKIGEVGRAKALITTELWRDFNGKPSIVYEQLSLTATPFAAVSTDMRWQPSVSALSFQPLPNAAAPDASAQRRLLQVKALAKRFGASEVEQKEKYELRLLPQPVDRYVPSSADRADGALFFFVFGTNPEIALFIESDGQQWSYAAGRLSGAVQLELTLDEQPVWKGSRVIYAFDQTYTSSSGAADIPGIAADGSEITE